MAVQYEFRQEELGVTLAILSGQLNLGNRLMEFEHHLKQQIEQGSRKIVLDLTGVDYIDSAGLGMVATCAGIMSKAGGKLVVVSAGGKVTQMFQLTHMDQVIGVYPDLRSACAAISESSTAASGA